MLCFHFVHKDHRLNNINKGYEAMKSLEILHAKQSFDDRLEQYKSEINERSQIEIEKQARLISIICSSKSSAFSQSCCIFVSFFRECICNILRLLRALLKTRPYSLRFSNSS